MSMTRLKGSVTRFFRHRGQVLRNLGGRRIRRDDDYLELYVLARVGDLLGAQPEQTRAGSGGKSIFAVATSPSELWENASYLRASVGAQQYGLRTGLSVSAITGPGTAELDVVLIALGPTVLRGRIPATQVVAGMECKAHRRALQQPHAHETLGKAHRVFGLPVTARVRGTTTVEPYCVVTTSGAAAGTVSLMRHFGVEHVNTGAPGDELGTYLTGLHGTL